MGIRQAETGHVEGSLAVAAGAGLVEGHPDDLVIVVPVARLWSAIVSRQGCVKVCGREGSQKEGNGKYPHGFALSVV